MNLGSIFIVGLVAWLTRTLLRDHQQEKNQIQRRNNMTSNQEQVTKAELVRRDLLRVRDVLLSITNDHPSVYRHPEFPSGLSTSGSVGETVNRGIRACQQISKSQCRESLRTECAMLRDMEAKLSRHLSSPFYTRTGIPLASVASAIGAHASELESELSHYSC